MVPYDHQPVINSNSALLTRTKTPPIVETNAADNHSIRRKPLPSTAVVPIFANQFPARHGTKYVQVSNDEDIATRTTESTAQVLSATASDESPPRRTSSAPWVPSALRLPWLSTLLLFNVALLATVIALHVRSVTHSGLVNDDDSLKVFFAWRFLPTIIAVIYVFAWMIIVDSVNRTEGFARLTRYDRSTARATISRVAGPWWSTLADSFPRSKNDHHFSLVMASAVIAYILGFLLLSPFSAALLIPRNVTHVETVDFHQLQIDPSVSLQPSLETSSYYQTIGHVLQNITTSAWITDNYTIFPFWPATFSSQPSRAQLFNNSFQVWRMNSLVMEADLSCENLKLDRGPLDLAYNYTISIRNETLSRSQKLHTITLSSKSGCRYGFAYQASSDARLAGKTYWSSIQSINIDEIWGLDLGNGYSNITHISDQNVLLNYTEACGSGQVIVSWINTDGKTFEANGHICTTTFTAGSVPTEVKVTDNGLQVVVDEEQYRKIRRPTTESFVNITRFQNSMLSNSWADYLRQAPSTGALNGFSNYGGPAYLLAGLYGFNVPEVMRDQKVVETARLIQQRAFGETVQSSLEALSFTSTNRGEVLTTTRRVVVVQAAAIVLEIVLVLHLLFALTLVLRSQQIKRPLGLLKDPALTNTVAALVISNDHTKKTFTKFDGLGRTGSSADVDQMHFRLRDGVLSADPMAVSKEPETEIQATGLLKEGKLSPVIPRILTTWVLTSLCIFVLAVLISIMILYWYSLRHGIYQSTFLYQKEITIGSYDLGTLAPYSVIPTLIAVIIGLWWSATESVFRLVQPYIAMARGATSVNNGSGLSYQSSYVLWAALRAIRRKHWLLALVCFGAFATQILTIAMSALWAKTPAYTSFSTMVGQPLQLRQIPHLAQSISIYKDLHVTTILEKLFEELRTSWMYSAAIQLTLNGSEPSWSKSGWSFVPLDLNSLTETANTVAMVQTPAIRARLDCTPWSNIDDSWWLLERDLTDPLRWKSPENATGYQRGYQIGCPNAARNDTSAWISAFANDSRTNNACVGSGASRVSLIPQKGMPLCCPQGTRKNPGTLSFGYWTGYEEWYNSSIRPSLNVNVKYFHDIAQKFETYITQDYVEVPSRLIWLQKPKLTMANCVPVIEKANARVTLDVNTGQVQEYQILETPKIETAGWDDPFVLRERFTPNTTAPQGLIWNVTTSYGALFLSALLGASQVARLGSCNINPAACVQEDPNDYAFNIKQPGLSVDYMTYSMLSLAGYNQTALLDPQTLISLAQQTFTTFFQHFVSGNISATGDGGWAYQRVNASLPNDLRPPYYAINRPGAPIKSSQLTDSMTMITVQRPVEMLRMSPAAVFISIAILAWLFVTTMLIIVRKKRYFSPLLRAVDTLTDVAVLVAGSERYLGLAKAMGVEKLQDDHSLETRLGWFRTSAGEVRWGIELAGGKEVGENEGVEFLSKEEVNRLRLTAQ